MFPIFPGVCTTNATNAPIQDSTMNNNSFLSERLQAALNWAYDKTLNGMPGVDSTQMLAERWLTEYGDPLKAADALIRQQNVKATACGFITGLGGMAMLPLTLPANLTGILFIQTRIVAAIAHLGGYDLRNDDIKALVQVCLCGNVAKELLKGLGMTLTEALLRQLSAKATQQLLSQLGQKSGISLLRCIPLAGGLVGGLFDSIATLAIGYTARNVFLDHLKWR